jgi:spore coat polysaccharide biosynthesis protein SpsF
VNKRSILVVVQCRYNSARLQGKALYPISGIPLLVFLLRRLRSGLSEKIYRLVLATTELERDNVIAAWGSKEGVAVFRGSEDDVLGRYAKCIESHPAEAVVRVTADNPLTCPEVIKRLAQEMERGDADYIQIDRLPYGTGADIFSSSLLSSLDRNVKLPDEREHINLHVLRHPENFKVRIIHAEGELARPDLRMTVDTREDWERLAGIFYPSEKEPWRIPLREAVKRMDPKPVC